MAWIDLDGSKFNSDLIACIRPIKGNDDQCVLFTSGQSATDAGFLIDMSIDDVFSAIQNARMMELAGMMEPVPDDQQTTGSAHPDEGNDHENE